MADPDQLQPCLRLFGSVDLIGSTAFKNRFWSDPKSYQDGKPPWFQELGSFYVRCMHELQAAGTGTSHSQWALVKTLGDEVLVSHPVSRLEELEAAVALFLKMLNGFNRNAGQKLRAKGCLWLAGFPINNAETPIPGSAECHPVDYLGPSMDAGFRLAEYATQRRLVLSVDLALLLTDTTLGAHPEFTFYYEGRERLSGVLNGRPYPLIWLAAGEGDSVEEELLGKVPCDRRKLHVFCRSFIEEGGDETWLIVPYLAGDERYGVRPVWHDRILSAWQSRDQAVVDPPEPADAPAGGTVTLSVDAVAEQVRKEPPSDSAAE